MGDDPEPAARAWPSVEGPAQQPGPLPHPDDAVTSRSGVVGVRSGQDGGAAPVVEDLDDDPAPVGAEPHRCAGPWTGVLEHVGERLLDDAVGEQVHPGREPGRDPVGGQRDVEAGRAGLLDEPGEVGQARLGPEAIQVGLGPEDPEQVA